MATLTGSSGADVLTPTPTADAITGREGDDVIVYSRAGNTHVDLVADFGSIYFGGAITGGQENPPVASAAFGTFSGTLRKGGGAFNFSATITGLDFGGQSAAAGDDFIAGHFHRGVVGVNGPIQYGFFGLPSHELDGDFVIARAASGLGGSVAGQWDAGEGAAGGTLTANVAALLAGQLYINFHTVAFPGGEIRGQTLRLDDGLDRIDLRGAGISDFETLQLMLTETLGSTEIATRLNGQTHTLRLLNVPLSSLTAGDFIFAGAAAGRVDGTAGVDDLFGGSGFDLILGLEGDDRLFGSGGGDYVLGGLGSDRLFGGDGVDLLGGEDGADWLTGGTGGDNIYGGAGDDLLFGEAGADFLSGGDGADVLGGNGGGDRLNGGAGADRFMFFPGDGALGQGHVIEDFATGVDRIDLSLIDANTTVAGDQAFTFRGIQSVGGGAGTLHLGFIQGVGVFLFGYTDGDATADVIINVGTFAVGAGDLIL